jgi:hypothetical protein
MWGTRPPDGLSSLPVLLDAPARANYTRAGAGVARVSVDVAYRLLIDERLPREGLYCFNLFIYTLGLTY